MIELFVNDYYISLKAKEGVRITRGNALMGETDLYSLPVEFCTDDYDNKAAIDYLNDIRVKGDRAKAFTAVLKINGIVVIDGYAVLNNSEGRYAELILYSKTLGFWNYAKEMNCHDIAVPVPSWRSEFDKKYITVDPEDLSNILGIVNGALDGSKDYLAFPMVNAQDVENTDHIYSENTIKGMYNYYNINTNAFVNNAESNWESVNEDSYYSRYHNTVFLRVGVAMRYIFESLGYTVESNIFEEDAYKDMVILNTYKFYQGKINVHYWRLLPNKSIYEILNDFQESGFVFDIDGLNNTVSITTANIKASIVPDATMLALHNTKKTAFETPKGYKVSMAQNGVYLGPTTGEAYEKYFEDTGYDWFGNTRYVNTLMDRNFGSILNDKYLFVKSEGTLWYYDQTGVWMRSGGNFGYLIESAVLYEEEYDVEINAPLAVALNYTNIYTDDYAQFTIIDAEPKEIGDTILQMYRGMQPTYTYNSNTDAWTKSVDYTYPHASYLAYDAAGLALSGLSLDTTFFYAINKAKIDFLLASYDLEYQFKGSMSDILLSKFNPVLIEGQKMLISTRSVNFDSDANELIFTDKGYIEQLT